MIGAWRDAGNTTGLETTVQTSVYRGQKDEYIYVYKLRKTLH